MKQKLCIISGIYKFLKRVLSKLIYKMNNLSIFDYETEKCISFPIGI